MTHRTARRHHARLDRAARRTVRADARATIHTARRMRRTYRRMYRTGPSPVARVFGWLALGAFVAITSGMGAVAINRHLSDTYGDRYGETSSTPPDYVRTRTCPTEDSCAWGWTGSGYAWIPVTP
jgi:hypothetical protein